MKFICAEYDRTKLKSLYHSRILSRKTCLGIFLMPFCCIPLFWLLALFYCVLWFSLTPDSLTDATGKLRAVGGDFSMGFLVFFWFWQILGRVTLCSFNLRRGWSLSFLDSIMMCVWCYFSLSFLLSKQKTFGKARSCHWLSAAVGVTCSELPYKSVSV